MTIWGISAVIYIIVSQKWEKKLRQFETFSWQELHVNTLVLLIQNIVIFNIYKFNNWCRKQEASQVPFNSNINTDMRIRKPTVFLLYRQTPQAPGWQGPGDNTLSLFYWIWTHFPSYHLLSVSRDQTENILNKVINICSKITGTALKTLQLYKKAKPIMSDCSHHLHHLTHSLMSAAISSLDS